MKLHEAKILLVDDEPELRDIFVEWLANAGCSHIRTAGNGAEAFALIQAQPVDLLISDVRMPVMSGVELVRRLSEHHLQTPSIIFVSGFGDIDAREMYGLGVEAFIAKPIKREDLLLRVERVLADPGELWLSPNVQTPWQSLEIDATLLQEFPCDHPAVSKGLCIGKGGFSTTAPEHLRVGAVTFDCRVNYANAKVGDVGRSFSGEGCVRWFSKSDHAIGIEFEYLDPACRAWVILEAASPSSKGFIPYSGKKSA